MEGNVNAFWVSLLKEEGGSFARVLVGGTFQGIGLAIIGIFVCYFLFRALKLLPKKGRVGLKVLTIAWLIFSLPLAGGFMGFQHSLEKAVRGLMTEGRFATEVMPELSVAISDFIFLVDDQMARALKEVPTADREHLNVVEFRNRLERMQDEWMQEVLTSSTASIREKYPFLNTEVPKQLFDGFVKFFGEKIIKNQISATADKVGIQFPIAQWMEGLPETEMSRQELSAYTVKTLLTAFFLNPLETVMKIQQTLGVFALLGSVLLPALLLWLVNRLGNLPGSTPRMYGQA
jgi:hypothetical protein